MPELPEVETTRRGIAPHIQGQKIRRVRVRDRRLRWPVDARLGSKLAGQTVQRVERRAKYLLFYLDQTCLILHLGMSGSLRVLPRRTAPQKHDHIDFEFADGKVMRFRDPRRFGSVHITNRDPREHPLLKNLGPEPLGADFTGAYLYRRSRQRTQPVKSFIMDSRCVVGIGNIYACESLFAAGIAPARRAGAISHARYDRLANAIEAVLLDAIKAGGTTLRDYVDGDGNPGYFERGLQVYGKAGGACPRCKGPIRVNRQGQRSTYYCPRCQR